MKKLSILFKKTLNWSLFWFSFFMIFITLSFAGADKFFGNN